MKGLSKAQLAQITTAMEVCHTRSEALQTAVQKYNDALDGVRGELGDKLNEYNESVTALQDFYEFLSAEAQEYYEGRSDAWKESDAASEYLNWIGEMEETALEQCDLEIPDEIEEPDLPDYTDTSWLPSEAPGE